MRCSGSATFMAGLDAEGISEYPHALGHAEVRGEEGLLLAQFEDGLWWTVPSGDSW